MDKKHIHFEMRIDDETLDRLARMRGCENRSEYLRELVRADVRRAQVLDDMAGR